ncbi:alanine--tRNA ligase [Candidatus Enterovibrio escicola]|uniref:alanine--tRNA ligase n=1 Tax=Candidatus Enterovibrio escicola TaxID=1927127 RepID=UPI001237AFC6|nr:alanine--tRNA ligase [Candidatus Enterovibrio escacola]
MYMSTDELRTAFLKFFESKGHKIVPSSSLVPVNDPTLLFTNAGMNQFKDCFLGIEKRDYTRATTAQRCVRAGGKHNDLENVGFTARHHTFFEMLGNFSFGDYFKEGAISYAWEFLTDVLKLPKDKLVVTIYKTDDEVFSLWNEKIGVSADRIIRIDDNKGAPYTSDNFWQMGDTGPCGPCTEIFFDHGDHIWGGPPGSTKEKGDRFIEIWNNVFMQYNRHVDGTMELLTKPSVDTGMGLERIAAIIQGVNSNYEIDIFQKLIKAAADVIGHEDLSNQSLRVVADHIRSCVFLIVDGVMPSNEGRGYVLRRIIRRAVRHGNKLSVNGAFLYKLVGPLVEVMGMAGEALKQEQGLVEKVLKIEEESFACTLDRGMAILNDALENIKGGVLDGKSVFKLYDTYGFPIDLTNDVARERGLSIDEKGFETAMEEQRRHAREASQFSNDHNLVIQVDNNTEFMGYGTTESHGMITYISVGSMYTETLSMPDEAVIVLDQTPFYAESGGQSGDVGFFSTDAGRFEVIDTKKYGSVIGHHGNLVDGNLSVGDTIKAKVDAEHRLAIALNHSATHLLHEALRVVLGEHVQQKGSLVRKEGLRFDFSNPEAVNPDEMRAVEKLVNAQIRQNNDISTEMMSLDAAKKKGAISLFGEKYDEQVRVLTIGDFSIELCGGTHASRSGDIGMLKIISESGIAAGIRRIEAVTGQGAENAFYRQQQEFIQKINKYQDRAKVLEKEIQQLKEKVAVQKSESLMTELTKIKGVNVLICRLDGFDRKVLRTMIDDLKNQMGSGVVFLGNVTNDQVTLLAGVTNDIVGKINAGELVNMVAKQVGGRGGGRPDMAQAGGSNASALSMALDSVTVWLSERL